MLKKAEVKGLNLVQADDQLDTWLAELSFESASRHISATIEWLKHSSSPAVKAANSAPATALPSAEIVPAGRYAIETESGAINELAFYKVDRPTEGRWAGKVFVKLMISDGEQRLSWATTKTVLAKIAEVGAAAASARYGHEIGECGVCGRTLTNDESRERGIGPVCAAKNSW